MQPIDVLNVEDTYLSKGISEEAQLANCVFERGEGSVLFDENGKQYVDFASGIFTQNVGHGHPHVVTQVKAQLDKLWNVHDSSTLARAKLCLELAKNLPDSLNKFAFFSTGAEAIEAAIRIVFSNAPPEKQRLAALRYGFHGKTQGARSLVHWDVGYQVASGSSVLGYAANCYRCPLERTYPSCDMQCAKLVNRHISSKSNIAALFFEPIQGAAGVIVPPKEYWSLIADECQKQGILLVADEVVSAGGRTGKFLASAHYDIVPDLVVAAKGLSSGFPFSMVAGGETLMDKSDFGSAGASSSTFGGNPMSCTAASATLEVLDNEQLIESVPKKGERLKQGLEALKCEYHCIGDVRGIGLLWAIEFVSDHKYKTPDTKAAKAFYLTALELGVRVCFGGNVIRIGPPFNISESQIQDVLNIFDQCLQRITDMGENHVSGR